MGANGWTVDQTFSDWMRSTEKKIGREQRRPSVRSASELLGPGFGPYATLTQDWGSDETAFTGTFYSEPGAQAAPNDTAWWIGEVLSISTGFGIQRLSTFRAPDWPPLTAVRNFEALGDSGIRSYSTWTIT